MPRAYCILGPGGGGRSNLIDEVDPSTCQQASPGQPKQQLPPPGRSVFFEKTPDVLGFQVGNTSSIRIHFPASQLLVDHQAAEGLFQRETKTRNTKKPAASWKIQPFWMVPWKSTTILKMVVPFGR